MKLEVRALYDNGERLALVLTDERGEPFPSQVATMLESVPGEKPTLHVSFAIDGEEIRMALCKQAIRPRPAAVIAPEGAMPEPRRLPWWRW